MENVNQIGVFSKIEPKINTVDELSAVLLNIKENYEEEGRGFPKTVRIDLSLNEWLSIVRNSKHDDSVSLGFDPIDKSVATISYNDYKLPFNVSIRSN